MPVNGLIAQWDILNMGVQVVQSGASAFSGEFQSLWTPDASSVLVGVDLQVSAASGSWSTLYNGPHAPHGGYIVTGSGIPGSLSIEAYFNNWRLYGVNPGGVNYLFHVFWDSIQIFVNGALSVTFASGDVVSNALGPSWVPIFSGLSWINGGAQGAGGTYNVTSQVNKGWRFSKGGVWYAPPITIPSIVDAPTSAYSSSPPPPVLITAPFDLALGSSIISTSTYGPQVNNSIALTTDMYGNVTYEDGQGGTVWLIPDMAKQYARFNQDFGATFFFFAAPLVLGQSTRFMLDVTQPSPHQATANANTPTSSRVAAGTYEVGHSTSPLEAVMGLHTYAPVTINHFHEESPGNPMTGYTTKVENLSTTFPVAMDSATGSEPWSTGAAYVAPYMSHADLHANYFNSVIPHPHWSIGYYTGPWTYASSPLHWEDYWGPVGEQYMSAQQRRNHIISCPLEDSGYTPFLDYYFQSGTGDGMRWIGVSRWQTQTFTPPPSLTLDANSSANWTVESSSCTLAFGGGGITVTPIASVCKFDLQLGNWFYAQFGEPYMYGAIAKSIFLNWPTTNITQVLVEAKSVDGTTLALLKLNPSDTTTTPNATYVLPRAQDAKYAGSWGLNNSYGPVSDVGSDIAAGGISATLMNDPGYVVALDLLLSGQPAILHFEVTVASTSATCLIDYPTFNAATNKLLVWENRQVADILYGDGPGLRLGNWDWDEGGGANLPAAVHTLGYSKSSVVDWLATRRCVLQGVDPYLGGTPNLATECTQLYDTYEGNSINQVGRDSIYFFLPPDPASLTEPAYKVALVNTWSEVPPLAGYPSFGRNPSNWSTNGVPAQIAYTWCQVPRRISSPNVRVDMLAPGGARITSPSSLAISGWVVTEHTVTVNNNEISNWQIVTGYGTGSQKTWGEATPWHGYYCELTLGLSASPRAYDVSILFRHGRVTEHVDTGHLWTGVSPNGNPYAWADVDSGISAGSARIRWQDNGNTPLGLLYPDGSGNLLWAQTKNEGQAYLSPLTIASTLATGGSFDFEETSDFLRWFYWQEGGSAPFTIYSKVLDTQLSVTRARTATNLTGADAAPLVVRELPVTGGGRTMGLLYSTGGVLKLVKAREGLTFGSPVTVSSTAQSGGFFDYCVGSDFNLWFYWQEGTAPSTIYMAVLDLQGNVVKGRTATNLTNADLAQIAVQEFPVSGGARKIGLMYAVAGAVTYVTARDGVHFS